MNPRESQGLLTRRERQILSLIGQAKTTKEIAYLLSLSVHTVGSHRRRLCDKLNLHSSTALGLYASNQRCLSDIVLVEQG
jgi:DNA-binding CsgD family transcriptional regulator